LLDSHPGVLLSCASEYPGRYQKRDLLLVNPPIQISARHHQLKIRALNARGEILLPTFYEALQSLAQVSLSVVDTVIVASPTASYAGGSRSVQEGRGRVTHGLVITSQRKCARVGRAVGRYGAAPYGRVRCKYTGKAAARIDD
jgi:hypothetical protein